jgi:hypothetical protein
VVPAASNVTFDAVAWHNYCQSLAKLPTTNCITLFGALHSNVKAYSLKLPVIIETIEIVATMPGLSFFLLAEAMHAANRVLLRVQDSRLSLTPKQSRL